MNNPEVDRRLSSLSSVVCSGHIDPSTVQFDVRSAYRFLKIRRTSPRLETLDAMIDECLGICLHTAAPRYQYRIVVVTRVETDDSLVELQDGRNDRFSFSSRGLAKALRNAEGAAFFALTLGSELDTIIERITVSDFTTAYVLDGVASALIHGLLAMLEHELRGAVGACDLNVGNRFSPGFHNWELSQQKLLFEILDCVSIGMELSESYYMTPRHSLTGVFALVRPTGTQQS